MMHKKLSRPEKFSVYYHNIFDFPLSFSDLTRWKAGSKSQISRPRATKFLKYQIENRNGVYFLNGREDIIEKRLQNEKASLRKMKIVKSAAKILSKISSVKMAAVTGSLAMMHSSEESDIDLLIITRQNTLWLSRLLVLVTLFLLDIPVRRSNDRSQCDKLCLNMWLDENDLVWNESDRNLYTAHEIAQIVPLVNKDKTYEKFLHENMWILDFWPNAVKIGNWKLEIGNSTSGTNIFEQIAYKIQLLYMKSKISREVVTPTRALFHPHDWGKVVLKRLSY